MGLLPARPARPRVRQVQRPDVAGRSPCRADEMDTALRIFGEAVAQVAGHGSESCRGRRGRRAPRGRGGRLTRRSGGVGRAMTASKVATMRDAIADLVRDGDTVAIEGFTHLISLRGRPRDHPAAAARPDPRAADARPHLRPDDRRRRRRASSCSRGSATRASAGSGAIRRRIEGEIPEQPLAVEEYSHFGMVGRYTAGAMNLPFFPLRSYFETDLPVANPLIRPIESPYGDGTVYAVPPLRPDVTIVHAQRASAAATPRSGACSAARRRPPSRPTGSSSSSRRSWTRPSSAPTRTGRSSRA